MVGRTWGELGKHCECVSNFLRELKSHNTCIQYSLFLGTVVLVLVANSQPDTNLMHITLHCLGSMVYLLHLWYWPITPISNM